MRADNMKYPIRTVKEWLEHKRMMKFIEAEERRQKEADVYNRILVNPKTGEINLKFNPMNIQEDFFITIRG